MKVIELFTFLFASGRIISLRLEHGVLHNIAIYSVVCEAHIWKHCYMYDHISSLKGEFVTTHKTSLRSVRTYSQQRGRMYIWEFWFPKNVMCAKNYIFYNITPYNGYLDSRCYPELRSYLRHTEWQVGISLTFFFHFIYFLDFKFMSDLLHYKWEICIPNMTA